MLISYENEAIVAMRQGDPVQYVIPPTTFKIENPVAVLKTSHDLDKAVAFKNFLYTPTGAARHRQGGLPAGRSADRGRIRKGLPAARGKLWTIADLGGWKKVDKELFDAQDRQRGDHLRQGDEIVTETDTVAPSRAVGAHRSWLRVTGSVGPLGIATAVLWLSVIVLLPLAALAFHAFDNGWSGFWSAATAPAALDALRVTVLLSVVVAVLNVVMGTLVAWVLVRDDFPGKSVVNALIDLPFALPTIVASIVMLALYGPDSPIGVHLNATQPGVVVALAFVTLPFVVRSVQPVLLEADRDVEQAAVSLGADSWTTFRRIILPVLAPAIVSGGAGWHSPAPSANSARWC